jgi:benzoyl-CoA 2,3-dioxygenase component B
MFIGESGVARVLQRTCEVMREHQLTDPAQVREQGVIDLETLQRFVNFHYSVTLDLFGSEISSNAATYYTTGLKGRYSEGNLKDDHLLAGDSYDVLEAADGQIVNRPASALTALNARLRDDYAREIQGGLDRWNRIPQTFGIPFRLTLPHVGFHRKIGSFAGQCITPGGRVIASEEWERQSSSWLPTAEDHAFVSSLMHRVVEPGKFANWISPPARGINNLPIEFEYVRFE